MTRLMTVVMVAMLLLFGTSCEHKELCYNHSHFAKVRVVFDWEGVSQDERPEGMRVVFFPSSGEGETWTFDFPGGEDATVEVPGRNYHVVCYNYDVEGIVWENEDDYDTFKANTVSASSPEGEDMRLTTSRLYGDYIQSVSLPFTENDEEYLVSLAPRKQVCYYTFEVHGVENIGAISDMRASLSGMSGGLIMGGDKLPENLSESLLFTCKITGSTISGSFYTFGYNDESNIFKLYLKNRSGKVYVVEQDVSRQIHDEPVTGHVGDVHIDIYVSYRVPAEPITGGDGGPGFDVGADDWEDVDIDITI